jgi:hypothetical protein
MGEARGTYAVVTHETDSRDPGGDPLTSGQKAHDTNAKKAAVAAASVFERMDFEGEMTVERNVYGAAIVIPQLARSTDYHHTYLLLACRAYLLLCVNFLLQFHLILFIGEASQVISALGGQMHLCNFGGGLSVNSCFNDSEKDCIGPGGTQFTPSRLYSYMQWNIQIFAKNALLAVLPEKEDVINAHVDPGEYGIENWSCRLVCCWLFSMSVVADFQKSLELLWLLIQIPTEAQPWIKYVPVSQADEKPEYRAFPALAMVDFKIAGMSLPWKVANILLCVIPKIILWWMVVWMGFRLLMETAGIINLVLGAMAMSFILGIDELVLETFGSQASMHILDEIDGYMYLETEESVTNRRRSTSEDANNTDMMSDDEALAYQEDLAKKSGRGWKSSIWLVFPKKLLACTMVMALFTTKYYTSKCHETEDGSEVSNTLYLPLSTTYTFLNMFSDSFSFGHFTLSTPARDLSKPLWCMPDEDCPSGAAEESSRDEGLSEASEAGAPPAKGGGNYWADYGGGNEGSENS